MDRLRRLAELAVIVGANVQPGQLVGVTAEVGHQAMARAVAEVAYEQGAVFVDVALTDPELLRSRVLHASPDWVQYAPRWPDERIRELDTQHGANIKITGPTAPGVLDDLDPGRVSRATPPRSRAWRDVEYRVNNTIVPGPNEAWARWLRPEMPATEALEALWRDICVACRLDQPDSVAAWRARFEELGVRAGTLTALGLDAVRLRGPGTDLVVGLAPGARWEPPGAVNHRGIWHAWNLPSEEVFTVPDRERADGHVSLTRPANVGGRLVHDVVLTFDRGLLTEISAPGGADALREFARRDEGTTRLGEIALVDGESAVAKTGQTFGVILLDENAASHIALGFGFPEQVDPADAHRVNQSGDHLDLMVGSDELEVTGLYPDGSEQLLLAGGRWLLG